MLTMRLQRSLLLATGWMLLTAALAQGALILYGDKDVLGTGTYATEPTAGAVLEGLAPNVITVAGLVQSHGFPFDPSP